MHVHRQVSRRRSAAQVGRPVSPACCRKNGQVAITIIGFGRRAEIPEAMTLPRLAAEASALFGTTPPWTWACVGWWVTSASTTPATSRRRPG